MINAFVSEFNNPIATHSLIVEGHELAAGVPEGLGIVIGGVHPGSFRVDPAHLPSVISVEPG